MLFPKIEAFIKGLQAEENLIPPQRQVLLLQLAGYIRDRQRKEQFAQLNFICTHNSRRSHLAQIWMAVAADYFGISGIKTYSGGTEATAFNPRAVAALERIGFQIRHSGITNPVYSIRYSDTAPALSVWSKTYDDPANPQRDFAAIMTCSEADEHCPFIPGATFRLSLTYEDPKVADGTPEEGRRYDERARQIGREICWMAGKLSSDFR